MFDGGHTGFDPYFHIAVAVALILGLACLGTAWWMP